MAQHLFNTSSSGTAAQLDGNFSDLYGVFGDVNQASKTWGLFAVPTLNTDGSYDVLQINGGGALCSSGTEFTLLTNNMGGTPAAPTHIGAFAGSYYLQNHGAHIWAMAASGSVGSPMTFTEVMRISSTGALLAGTTSNWTGNTSAAGINYDGAASEYGLSINTSATTGRAINFIQGGNATGGGSPTSVGSITVTTTATAYNTSSDYRLKDDVAPIDAADSGAFLDALNPVSFTWKSNGTPGRGFLAHELQAVSPSSVVGDKDATVPVGNLVNDADGTLLAASVAQPDPVPEGQTWTQTGSQPIYQAVEYGSAEVIAMLVAEVKSLRARLVAAGIA